MPKCARCKRRPKQRLKNRLDSLCKVCRSAYGKEHYQNNRKAYLARRVARQPVDRQARRDVIQGHKKKPCTDCKLPHPPWRMDFDHRPGEKKLFCIGSAQALSVSTKRLEAEILKCDLVCANCHRDRTHSRKVNRSVA